MLYVLSDIAYILLYKIAGYRKKVVQENLRNAFPNKTTAALKTIEKQFYQHLFDILLEGIKGFSLSKDVLLKRQVYLNQGLPQQLIDRGKSAIIVGGHYGNWEWGGMIAPFYVTAEVAILFSPIKNPYIDHYIKTSRGLYNTTLWASHQAPRAFKTNQGKPTVFVLIADQSPSNPKRAYWLQFLNQDTAVLRGPAAYAHSYNIPLLFIDIQRVKRGYYTMEVSMLAENPQDYQPEELSALYMQKLEACIHKRPELWLWSHRRWKHKKDTSHS